MTTALDTAWSRFQRRDRGRGPSTDEALMRALEQSVPAYGLDASAVALAAEVASFQAGLDDEGRRALTLLLLVTMADVEQGCTRTPFDRGHLLSHFTAMCRSAETLDGRPSAVFASDLVDRAGRLPVEANEVVGRKPSTYAPLLLTDTNWLYQQRMLVAEGRLAVSLAARRAEMDGPVDAAVEAVNAQPAGFALSQEQAHAVASAARHSLALVSGGPGTGKTSIVVALLRTFVRLGVAPAEIALAAPTGKAADRMGEAIREGLAMLTAPEEADATLLEQAPRPSTLHRLLGHHPRRDTWRHHANHLLPHRVVVVDECSMVDVFLMGRLLAAVRSDAHLVLLGDADQLPSVAAGAVFRDALDALPDRRVRLTHSYRMRAEDPAGREVLTLANTVNEGVPAAWNAVPSRELDALAYAGVEHLDGDARPFLRRWFRDRAVLPDRLRTRTWRTDDHADLDLVFAHLGAARVLCVTRGYETGAERVNARLHALAAAEARQPAAIPLLVGEPVMMLHNDYDRRLFNGDTGVVLFAPHTDGPRPRAFFRGGPDGYRSFALATLSGRLDLCYATTVHKAQGSEFDAVALVLPENDGPLLTRELLYTAVTRSRRSVVVVGARALVRRATERGVLRYSGLAEQLKARVAGGST